MNVAIWESTEALATAFGSPEFQCMAAEFPDDIVSYPHIFGQGDVQGSPGFANPLLTKRLHC
ncbi:hypothetical protein [Streptomyces blastmyceticus]|uniref:Antibiotic biosynthesis monooxygenase n=1 Tax=Streptomyces blastmyceticus TaxID=68180 RepID=A0ABN0WTL9_9ACTN